MTVFQTNKNCFPSLRSANLTNNDKTILPCDPTIQRIEVRQTENDLLIDKSYNKYDNIILKNGLWKNYVSSERKLYTISNISNKQRINKSPMRKAKHWIKRRRNNQSNSLQETTKKSLAKTVTAKKCFRRNIFFCPTSISYILLVFALTLLWSATSKARLVKILNMFKVRKRGRSQKHIEKFLFQCHKSIGEVEQFLTKNPTLMYPNLQQYLMPLINRRQPYKIPVFANDETQRQMQQELLFNKPHYRNVFNAIMHRDIYNMDDVAKPPVPQSAKIENPIIQKRRLVVRVPFAQNPDTMQMSRIYKSLFTEQKQKKHPLTYSFRNFIL